ncbi:unnamed protein product [Umbelopsis vinacea]
MSQLPPLVVSPSVSEFFLHLLESHWEQLQLALSSSPTETYFRVIVPTDYRLDLTFLCAARERRAEILPRLQEAIDKTCEHKGWDINQFRLQGHPILADVLFLPVLASTNIEKPSKELMIDTSAGMAVLRGADIFAPGILAIESDVHVDDKVSVDLEKKCLRGFSKNFQGRKVHVGNGILTQSRHAIFSKPSSELSGDGVIMTEPLCRTCGIPPGMSDLVFLQNITSTLTATILDVGPDDIVLDMCASPGGKTVHIASMLRGTGFVIAIDKNKYKTDRIHKNAKSCKVEGKVKAYAKDSTNLEGSSKPHDFRALQGQGFEAEVFDRIMLDPPCTGFGQRPMFSMTKDVQEVRSFRDSQPMYQKRLMSQAVRLLKAGGTMVYSTCTLNPYENEAVVAYCLEKHPNMELVTPDVKLGEPGLEGYGLTASQCAQVQRFDPVTNPETVGFFIAKLCKKSIRVH